MAETIPDLTDAQIEQLLSAAEVSLASKTPADKAVAVRNKQQSLAVTDPAPAPSSAARPEAGQPGGDAVKHSRELTLRVPQLRVKNKKVSHILSSRHSPFMMKTISQISNDAGRTSVMAANPAPQ